MNKKMIWAVCLLILASLACQLPFLSADEADGSEDIEKSLSALDVDTFDAAVNDPNLLAAVPLSPAQRQVLLVKGHPNRFLLMFVDGIREETWHYDQFGYDVTFRNGDVFTESDGSISEDWVDFVTIYSPWQFNGEMGLSGLLVSAEADTFAAESLAEPFQEDLSLVYMKGLVAGLRGEDLLFVRTIPIGEGARILDIPISQPTAQSQLAAVSNLTAAEQIHAGTHSYRTTCTYSDGTSEDFIGPTTWTFAEDGVNYNGDGPFPWRGENLYGLSETDGSLFINFKENVITFIGESSYLDEKGEEVLETFTCVLTQE